TLVNDVRSAWSTITGNISSHGRGSNSSRLRDGDRYGEGTTIGIGDGKGIATGSKVRLSRSDGIRRRSTTWGNDDRSGCSTVTGDIGDGIGSRNGSRLGDGDRYGEGTTI